MDHIQALVCNASDCFGSGNLKSSYDLYLRALDAAIIELRQIKFIDQYAICDSTDGLFALAKTCLDHTQTILTESQGRRPTQQQQQQPPPPPPPLPPKPPSIMQRCTTTVKTTQDELKPRARIYNTNNNSSPPASPLLLSAPIHAVKNLISTNTTSSTYKKADMHHHSPQHDELVQMASGAIDPSCVVEAQSDDLVAVGSNGISTLPPTTMIGTCTTAEPIPSIPQAPLMIIYHSLQQKLDYYERHKLPIADVKQSLNRVRHIHMSATTVPTILQFAPIIVAYQLTLIDSAIFRHIQPSALLKHQPPKALHPAIVASTDFFNYLTRLIEHAILLQQEASGRAQQINYWVKIAWKCHDLRNFQTTKAIVSALGTPPIQRLKRSWAFVPKKAMARLELLSDILSEKANYEQYRERLLQQSSNDPVVPFLGLFMHDLTYLHACGRKADHVLTQFATLQSHPPYTSALPSAYSKDFSKKYRTSSVEMQQCLVTQYLLTRSWVSEKVVDELSQLREPPAKVIRSNSAVDESSPSSVWSSTGSLLSFVANSTNSSVYSRPVSLDDEDDDDDMACCDHESYKRHAWMLGRKSVDNNSNNNGNHIKKRQQFRLSRHFSFEDLDGHRNKQQQQQQGLSLFRKDFTFWRSAPRMDDSQVPHHPLDQDPMYQQPQQPQQRNSISIA